MPPRMTSSLALRSALVASFMLLAIVACDDSTDDTTPGGAIDAGGADGSAASNDSGSTPTDSGAEGAAAADASSDAGAEGGFHVTAATNAALVGAYALKLDAFVNGAETAYNGADPEAPAAGATKPRVEMEVVTDASNQVKRAHFWNYDASGTTVDKTYGCDGTATLPCSGFSVDTTKKVVSFAAVVWKEVTPDLTGQSPDTVVGGGGTVTLDGDVVIK